MKSDLSYIDAASKRAVGQQRALPVISAERELAIAAAHTKPIAGLTVFDEASAETEREKDRAGKRRALRTFASDAQQLTSTLADRKIVPLAVLPATAWHAMCQRAGLYTIVANEAGLVNVSAVPLAKFEAHASRVIKRIRGFGLTLLSVAALALIGFGSVVGLFWQSVVVAFFLFTIFNSVVYDKKKETGRTTETVAVKKSNLYQQLVLGQLRRFAKKPLGQALDLLLPNRSSPDFSELKARVILPEPPADVMSILLKARGLALKTAAVPEAIAFAESPAQIYARGFDETLKLDSQKWAQVRRENDPIVFLQKGTAVAIIAQFGDFPIEKELVDSALFGADLIA